jgi:hypothetical protein
MDLRSCSGMTGKCHGKPSFSRSLFVLTSIPYYVPSVLLSRHTKYGVPVSNIRTPEVVGIARTAPLERRLCEPAEAQLLLKRYYKSGFSSMMRMKSHPGYNSFGRALLDRSILCSFLFRPKVVAKSINSTNSYI